jgi:uncharacterized membrane protein YdjX (TVP38/TMEM64 family)
VSEAGRKGRLAGLVFLSGIIIIAFLNRDSFQADAISIWLDEAGIWGPFAFIAFYTVATVLFLPGWILTTSAGALWGPIWGTVYALTGATLGAVAAFLVARYLAADEVERRLGDGLLKKVKQGVEEEGWRFVAFTRLVPLFPFNVLNYAFGLTRIRLKDYLWPTFVFMLPGGFAYVYLGYAGSGALSGSGGIQRILIAIALLALVAYLPRLIKRFKAPKNEADGQDENQLRD